MRSNRHPGESRDPGLKPSFKIKFKTWAPAFAGATVAWLVFSGCKQESVTTQWVTKEKPRVAAGAESAHRDVEWKVPLPEGWVEQPLSAMRVGSFLFERKDGTKADISIVRLAGEAGGDAANMNRWRGQINLSPLSDDDVKRAVKIIHSSGRQMKLIDFSNAGKRLVAVTYENAGVTWFIKMMGDERTTSATYDKFRRFIDGLKFHDHAHE